MVSTWTTRAIALLALVAWALMCFAIAAAGGAGKSGLQTPLFVTGLVLEVVAAALLGTIVAGLRAHDLRTRVAGAVLGVAAGIVVVGGLRTLTRYALPHGWGWFRADAGLLAGALVVFAAAFVVHDSRRRVRRRAADRATLARAEEGAETREHEPGAPEHRERTEAERLDESPREESEEGGAGAVPEEDVEWPGPR